MNDEPTGGADDDTGEPPTPTGGDGSTPVAPTVADGDPADLVDGADEHVEAGSPATEIIDLPWDDDLPVALGEETDAADGAEPRDHVDDGPGGEPAADGTPGEDSVEGEDDDVSDLGELSEHDRVGGRRNALPRRVESWRSRSATGAIATAIAMGLQQVFEPERRRPAAVAEAPSDPYSDDDPITVDYVPDDAEATTVHVKPWLLQKGEPG